MGGDICNNGSPRGLPSQDCNTYCGDDGAKGRRQGMLVGIG